MSSRTSIAHAAVGGDLTDGLDSPAFPLRPDTYELRRSIGYLMIGNSRMAMALAERVFSNRADLGFVQFLSLMALRDGLASTPGELAGLIGHSSGSVTRMIDAMERDGLVERSRNRRDRRSISLALTDRGRGLAADLLPRAVELWNEVLGTFSGDEYRLLVQLLEKLQSALKSR